MEKCKHAPRNSFDEKSPNIPPSCPQLSSCSFRSPPTTLGCQATAVLLKLCQGDGERAGKNRGGKKKERGKQSVSAPWDVHVQLSRRPSASGAGGDRPSDTPPYRRHHPPHLSLLPSLLRECARMSRALQQSHKRAKLSKRARRLLWPEILFYFFFSRRCVFILAAVRRTALLALLAPPPVQPPTPTPVQSLCAVSVFPLRPRGFSAGRLPASRSPRRARLAARVHECRCLFGWMDGVMDRWITDGWMD